MITFLIKSKVFSGHEKMFKLIYDNFKVQKFFIDLNIEFDLPVFLKCKTFFVCVGYPAQNLFLIFFLRVLRKRVYIYTPFGFELKYYNVNFASIKENIYKLIYSGSNIKIVTCSRVQSKLFQTRFPNKEIFYLNNFSDSLQAICNNQEDKNNVYYIGRIDQIQKNCLIFSDLARKSKYVYHLIGNCTDSALLKKLMHPNIIIHRHKLNPFNLLHKNSCLVLPSFYEGAPLVIIEACVNNIPIFLSNCVGNCDFAEEALIFSSISELRIMLDKHFIGDFEQLNKWSKFKYNVLSEYNKEVFLVQLNELENRI